MADGFEAMVAAAQAFFPELAANNSKDWFAEHKAHYSSDIAKPAALFADLVGEDLGRMTGRSLKPKVFRVYRDVRFSKDKTPLNTHLHLMWSGAEPLGPTWFWGLSPEYFILGMGIMGLKGAELARFRAFVDAEGQALTEAMDAASAQIGATLSEWGPEPLKRVPKPYSEDHPQADLLRRKAFALTAPVGDNWRDAGVVAETLRLAEGLRPVHDLLIRGL